MFGIGTVASVAAVPGRILDTLGFAGSASERWRFLACSQASERQVGKNGLKKAGSNLFRE